jgi:hypothetical protein
MAYQVKPVYGPDYGQLLMQGLQTYRGVKGMQREEAEEERSAQARELMARGELSPEEMAQLEALSPQAAESRRQRAFREKTQARQEKEWSREDADRIFRDTAILSSSIKGLPPNQQIPIVESYIADKERRNEDPIFTKKLLVQLKNNDPQAQVAINTRYKEGLGAKIIPPPTKITEKKSPLRVLQEEYEREKDPARKAEIKKNIDKTIAPTKGQTINVGTGEGLKEFQNKEFAKKDIDATSKWEQAAFDAAENAMNEENQMDTALSIGVAGGGFEPWKQVVAKYAQSSGLAPEGWLADVPAGEAFNREVNDMMIKAITRYPDSRPSDAEVRLVRTTQTELGDTVKGRIFKIYSMKAGTQRVIEKNEFIENWVAQGKDRTQARREWNKKNKNTPFVSRYIRSPNHPSLPVFYWQFKAAERERNPDITDDAIIIKWNEKEKSAKEYWDKYGEM